MSVSLGPEQVRSRGGDRRDELGECLPALRESLERERAFRVEQLNRLTIGTRRDPVRGKPGADAAGDALREVDAVVLAGARQALADIDRALAAIRAGQYGRCEDCADEIPFAVLRAVPQARRCLRCQCARSEDSPVLTAERGSGTGPEARVRDRDGRAASSLRLTPPPPKAAHCVPASSRSSTGSAGHGVLAPAQPVVWVRRLLGRPVLGPEQQHLGHVRDVVAHRLPDAVGTIVTGLIADVGGHCWFAPAAAVRDWQRPPVVLRVFSNRPARCRHSAEYLLAKDVLGQPVMTARTGPVPRISDIALRRTPAGWAVCAADTRSTVQRLLGSPRRLIEWDVLAMRRLATPPQARSTIDGG